MYYIVSNALREFRLGLEAKRCQDKQPIGAGYPALNVALILEFLSQSRMQNDLRSLDGENASNLLASIDSQL